MGSKTFSNLKTIVDVQDLFCEFMTRCSNYEFEGYSTEMPNVLHVKTTRFFLYEIIAAISFT